MAAALAAAAAAAMKLASGSGQQLELSGLSREEARSRYRCVECGKGFITPSKLQRHSYSHTGQRPFHCDVCAKSFSQSANLKTHIRNTHPELAHELAPARRSTSGAASSPSSAASASAATASAATENSFDYS